MESASIYRELADWYPLLDPVTDHTEDAELFRRLLQPNESTGQPTLLELASGAGNNAHYLQRDFRCTLTDISKEMLELSSRQNPDCEHLVGDMRTLKLDRQFDAILAHDGLVYLTSQDDLYLTFRTIWHHLRPGGRTLLAPDYYADSFSEVSELHRANDGERSLRCLEWCYDPDPTDTEYLVDYVYLLREGSDTRVVHDRHVEGLFSLDLWRRGLRETGFEVEVVENSLGPDRYGDLLLCRRP